MRDETVISFPDKNREAAYCWWDDATDVEVSRVAYHFGLQASEIDDLGLSELPAEIQAYLISLAADDSL